MYKNIISIFFSFPSITENVLMDKVRENRRRLSCTHRSRPNGFSVNHSLLRSAFRVENFLVIKYSWHPFLRLNCDLKPFNCVQKRVQARQRMLSTKCVYKSYIYLMYMCEQDLVLNNLQGFICHKTKPNQSAKLCTF